MPKLFILALIFIALFNACAPETENDKLVKAKVKPELIEQHIQTLASDDFGGRKPFSPGETKTINYIRSEFQKMGLKPGNGESYFQKVPLVEIEPTVSELRMRSPKMGYDLYHGDDFVAYSERVEKSIRIVNSELVFAGYGIVAPEYDWNDYEGIDVEGKTVIVLVNDPGFGSGDSTLFKGDEMTYYGRWTYKYEEAAKQGAEGILIVHETVPAGYPWVVVNNSATLPRLILDDDSGDYRCAFQGWLTRQAAVTLFSDSEKDITNYRQLARQPNFKAMELGMSVSLDINNVISRDISYNVAAKITGTEKPDETIIFTAHWDHLGTGNPVDGDSIYNGAIDNATGTAALLSIAEAFTRTFDPARTVVFLAVTAEEQGLLGSEYYVENPIYPLPKTVANINMDVFFPYGPYKDLTVIGYGQSELEDIAAGVADGWDRYIKPDPDPGKGYFYRSDHFNFAKVGVPSLYASGSYEPVNGNTEEARQKKEAYTSTRYHRPQDEYDPNTWNIQGMYQDVQLLYEVGVKLVSEPELYPEWKADSEFKALRP